MATETDIKMTRRELLVGTERETIADADGLRSAPLFFTGVDCAGVGWQRTSKDFWTSTEYGELEVAFVPIYMVFPLTGWK